VLYGTNAFSGVINLVTKEATETPSLSLKYTAGSHGHNQKQITASGKWGDFEIYATANKLDSQGDSWNGITDEFGNVGKYETGSDGKQLLVNATYKGFTLNALHSKTKSDNVRSIFIFPSTQHNYDRQFIDVGYHHAFSENWQADFNLSWQQTESVLPVNTVPIISANKAKNFLAELNTRFKVGMDAEVLLGGTYHYIDNEGSIEADAYNSSFYSQLSFQTTDWLKLVAGFQYNKPENLSGEISPRFSAIAHFDEHWGVKLLYGEAFREASIVDKFVSVPALSGNPDLNPETIETFDAQLFYQSDKVYFAATYFHSKTDDLITRVPGTPVTFTNGEGITYQGLELESQWQLNEHVEVIGNVTYQTSQDDEGEHGVTYAPEWMAKFGIAYDTLAGMQLSVFNSYFAESALQNEDLNPVVSFNDSADSYHLLTANLNLNVGRLLNRSMFNDVTLSVYADNLLDEEILFPSINRTTVNSIPHHAGRGIYATIGIDF
jgi:outer membrane receptor protein involved in Fe transport